ncbi:hypothetical protein FBQ87_16405, partial [Sphingobacteriales bacterium CHB3]|nr:hypothetical protein [Sphingobacteriales bacterium CHB3]
MAGAAVRQLRIIRAQLRRRPSRRFPLRRKMIFRSDSIRMNRRHSVPTISIFVAAFLIQSGTLCASWRKPVSAKNGMVVSAESLATQAGVDILKNGGNAIDAAIAVGFTLAVTYPEAGNIGGGGFMLIRLANSTTTMIDFREKAPAKASRNMYLDSNGNVIPMKSELGPLAAGVPGTVAGYLHALEKYGTLSRQRVIAPAIEAAVKGFPLSERFVESLKQSMKEFSAFPSTMNAFTKKGTPYEKGEILRQPDLANTLRNISAFGVDGFYRGYIAELI